MVDRPDIRMPLRVPVATLDRSTRLPTGMGVSCSRTYESPPVDRSVRVSLGHSGRNMLFVFVRTRCIQSLHADFLG